MKEECQIIKLKKEEIEALKRAIMIQFNDCLIKLNELDDEDFEQHIELNNYKRIYKNILCILEYIER